jgi:SAM-dependent methyltransferase
MSEVSVTMFGPPGPADGYEAVAQGFMASRSRSTIGRSTVAAWAGTLTPGAAVLDLGCGHGVPISQTLIDHGLSVYGVEASPTLCAAFRARFPHAYADCASVEGSRFFDRRFDAVIAWGLMFLLAREAQARVIPKVAAALNPGGKFLFTAPRQNCGWPDAMTGQTSISLGAAAYRRIIESAALVLDGETDDEGENHYYFVRKPS